MYSGTGMNEKTFGFSSHLSGGSCFIHSTETAEVPVKEEIPFLSVQVSENQSTAEQCCRTQEHFSHLLSDSQSS